MLNYTNSLNLTQNLEFCTGIPHCLLSNYKIKAYETLKGAEVEEILKLKSHPEIGMYISSALYENERELEEISELVDFINSKRAVMFIDELGQQKFICIPTNRDLQKGVLNHYNALLLKFAIAYKNWKDCDPINKNSTFEEFSKARFTIQREVAKRLYSKNFKDKFNFQFNGISGVALTSNCEVNGIEIPKWYADEVGFEIGEIGIVTRDPIQNLFITLKVVGFTENEIRVNGHTYTMLDGDFDGDRIQFIPWKNILKQMKSLNVDVNKRNRVLEELYNLLPTVLINRDDCSHLTADYDRDLIK